MGFVVGGSQMSYYPTQADALAFTNNLGGQNVNAPTPFIVGDTTYGSNGGYTLWLIASNSTGSASQLVTYANGVSVVNDGVYYMYPATAPCFPAGTRILTAEGYKVVESLTNEDKVQTADGRLVRPTLFKIPITKTTTDTAPYRIEAGAFGSNYPPYPLSLSPLHAIQDPTGTWHIPQVAAKDNDKITQYDVGKAVTYYHIECPDFYSDNLIAEGAVVESFKHRQGVRDVVYEWVEELKGFRRLPKEERRSVSKKENTLVVY
jgi:hypothetical protein